MSFLTCMRFKKSWNILGKENGLKCYEKVRKAIDGISPNINVILKCACTEFELKNGPPVDYVATQEQLDLEAIYEQYISLNDLKFNSPDYLHVYILLSFIHRAAKIGDSTYKEFTNGLSLVRGPKTYHDEIGELKNG